MSSKTMRDELENLFKDHKLHNKDIDACFNDAIAVTHLLTSIINLVDKSLPEKHVCTDECKINSREWIIGHKAYKDAESNTIDDMLAKLKGVSNG